MSSSVNCGDPDNDTMQPLRPPAHETTIIDDDAATDTERARDDVPVLACENGDRKIKPISSKKTQYLRGLKLPKLACPVRCREGLILSIGVVMTCLALGLIVAGALRSDDHGSRSAFLHVSSLLKRPLGPEVPRKPVRDDVFTFDQLLSLSNYALNKPTQQSSVFLKVLDIPELDGESDFAVDGSVNTCARTDLEENPFWYVDLGQIEHLGSVRLYGSDANRLHDFDVHLGNFENVTDNTLCMRYHGNTPSLDVRVVCDTKLSGRYLGIVMRTGPSKPESLIICEVLVYLT